jgi:anti-sigma factor RsiW
VSACPDKELLLHGLLDGELDAANTLSFEAHLGECAACAAEFKRLQALRSRLRIPGVAFEAPAALRARIAAVVGTEALGRATDSAGVVVLDRDVRVASRDAATGGLAVTAADRQVRVVDESASPAVSTLAGRATVGSKPGMRAGVPAGARSSGLQRGRKPLFAWAWAGSVTALAASLAFVLFVHVPRSNITDELVAGHVRSLLASHLVDVVTSDRHVVKPWFAGKVDFAPPVLELTDQGFPLVGGRLDYIHGRVVAAVVYRRRQHIINVFVWPAGAGPALAGTARHDGYNVASWSQGGLDLWAVSDVDPADLQQLRAAFVTAQAPRTPE